MQRSSDSKMRDSRASAGLAALGLDDSESEDDKLFSALKDKGDTPARFDGVAPAPAAIQNAAPLRTRVSPAAADDWMTVGVKDGGASSSLDDDAFLAGLRPPSPAKPRVPVRQLSPSPRAATSPSAGGTPRRRREDASPSADAPEASSRPTTSGSNFLPSPSTLSRSHARVADLLHDDLQALSSPAKPGTPPHPRVFGRGAGPASAAQRASDPTTTLAHASVSGAGATPDDPVPLSPQRGVSAPLTRRPVTVPLFDEAPALAAPVAPSQPSRESPPSPPVQRISEDHQLPFLPPPELPSQSPRPLATPRAASMQPSAATPSAAAAPDSFGSYSPSFGRRGGSIGRRAGPISSPQASRAAPMGDVAGEQRAADRPPPSPARPMSAAALGLLDSSDEDDVPGAAVAPGSRASLPTTPQRRPPAPSVVGGLPPATGTGAAAQRGGGVGSQSGLRVVSTTAEMTQQKDAEIEQLKLTVARLEAQISVSSEEAAAKREAAVAEARRAALKQLADVEAELAAAKAKAAAAAAAAEQREEELQRAARDARSAAQDAAAAAEREAAAQAAAKARAVEDAKARARADVEAELREMRAQVVAERLAVADEKALLERHRQSTQLLTELSARVESATALAIDRESRVARQLDAGLLEREHRCVRLEAELADRELVVAAREKEGEALRRHLAQLTASMQHELFQGQTDVRQERERLEREHARLDSMVKSLEAQREDIASTLAHERASLENARRLRIEESARFLEECDAERRRIAEERTAAWLQVDQSRGDAMAAKSKAAEFEARASSALRAATEAGEKAKAAAAEVDAFYAQIEAEKAALANERADLEQEGARLVEQGIQLQHQTAELAALSAAGAAKERELAGVEERLSRDLAALELQRAELEAQRKQLGFAHAQVEAMRVAIAEERAALTADKIKASEVRERWRELQADVAAKLREWRGTSRRLPEVWEALVSCPDGATVTLRPVDDGGGGGKENRNERTAGGGRRDAARTKPHDATATRLAALTKTLRSDLLRGGASQQEAFLRSLEGAYRGIREQPRVTDQGQLAGAWRVGPRPAPRGASDAVFAGFDPVPLGEAGAEYAASGHPATAAAADLQGPFPEAGRPPAQMTSEAAAPAPAPMFLPFMSLHPLSTTEDSFSHRSFAPSRERSSLAPSASALHSPATSKEGLSPVAQQTPQTSSSHDSHDASPGSHTPTQASGTSQPGN